MAKINLHIFNDWDGFFSSKTIDLIRSIESNAGDNVFVNYMKDAVRKKKDVVYATMDEFLKNNPQLKIKEVIFHSYNYFNHGEIKKIKKSYAGQSIKFIWVFWSHEYYQLPEFLPQMYQGLSRRFYLRKLISFHLNQVSFFLKGKARFPFYQGLSRFKKTFREFDLFCSLIKGDYDIVMKGDEQQVPYAFTSYIEIRDFPAIELNLAKVKTEIMIGHSGAPVLNHYEVIKQLAGMKVNSSVFMPFSYGKPEYMNVIKKKIEEFKNLDITIQTEFLPKDMYYRKLDSIGYFILNAYCQQALGNIMFFLWAGTKVFLRKNTSTYKTLKEKTFYVYSVEDDLNLQGLSSMSLEEKQHNHQLTVTMLNEDTVRESWRRIINFYDGN